MYGSDQCWKVCIREEELQHDECQHESRRRKMLCMRQAVGPVSQSVRVAIRLIYVQQGQEDALTVACSRCSECDGCV